MLSPSPRNRTNQRLHLTKIASQSFDQLNGCLHFSPLKPPIHHTNPISCEYKMDAGPPRSKPKPAFLFLTLLLLLTSPLPSNSLFFTPYQTLFSLSHSLITRVANLRASRGDHSGAARAKLVAEKLERWRGLGLWGFMGSMGWDYARNYAWGDLDSLEMYRAVKDVNELMKCINELTRMDSEGNRVDWVRRNYGNVLRVLKSLFTRLLQVFRKPVCFAFASLPPSFKLKDEVIFKRLKKCYFQLCCCQI